MYAFVLYDKMNDEYMVARDPFGIIPLYMGYGVDGSVWFSSEMKALQVNFVCNFFYFLAYFYTLPKPKLSSSCLKERDFKPQNRKFSIFSPI